MANKIIFNFDNADNFDRDQNKIEVVGSLSKLIAQTVPGEAAIYAKLDENAGLVARDSSGNNRDGAFQGGYTENQWVPGKIGFAIVGISLTNGFVNFDQLLEYEWNEAFSLECWFKTSSAATMAFITKQKSSGNFEGFGLNFSAGKVRFVIRDLNGNINTIESVNTYNDNIFHHVVVTYNGSNNISGLNIYVDNVIDKVITSSGTFNSTIKNDADLQLSGRDGNNLCIDSDTILDEMVVYSRELSAAEVAFRWNLGNGTQVLPGSETLFPIDNPNIIPFSKPKATEIKNITVSKVEPGNDEVRHTLELNGVDTWFNGSAWAQSSGYGETNTIPEMNANLTLLDLTEQGKFFALNNFLHSENGTTTPTLSQIEIEYDFAAITEECTEVIVKGNLKEFDCTESTEIITIELSEKSGEYKNTIQAVSKAKYVTPNPDGSWQIGLISTDNMENIFYVFIINKRRYEKLVPDIDEINFNDLQDMI